MPYNLIVRPKCGKFLKNYDTFNKMDPFLKVTFGNEEQKSDVAQGHGKTPVWKKVLSFPVSVIQANNISNLSIMFEAYDEDVTQDEWIGYISIKLGQLKLESGTVNTLTLMDKNNAAIGTIDVEIEFSQAPNATENKSPQKLPVKRLVGTVIVRPFSGKLEAASGLNDDSQQVYLLITYGGVTYRTPPSDGSGRTPKFTGILTFQEYENDEMVVGCYESRTDAFVGEGVVKIAELRNRLAVSQGYFVKLTDANRKFVGELNLEFEFLDDLFNNPVQTFATVAIKKGTSIGKKIKYRNPDKVRKTLKVTSDNKNLILVKNETITVNPGESGEIKFTFFAPQDSKSLEEICKVEVLDEASRVEESLLFKIKAV